MPWDAETGSRWAELLAHLRSIGRPMPIKDSLIAATALTHGIQLATLGHQEERRMTDASLEELVQTGQKDRQSVVPVPFVQGNITLKNGFETAFEPLSILAATGLPDWVRRYSNAISEQ